MDPPPATGELTESYVVDAGSIAVSRRRRRAKTDAIDGETLLRTLLAWKRGEPRVCAMVGQGITGYEPLQKDRRARLLALKTADGQPLGERLRAELSRELDVLELLLDQIRQLNAENEAAIETKAAGEDTPGAPLARLKEIGPQIVPEDGFHRHLRRLFQRAAVLEIRSDPGRPKAVIAELGDDAGGVPAPRDHQIRLARNMCCN